MVEILNPVPIYSHNDTPLCRNLGLPRLTMAPAAPGKEPFGFRKRPAQKLLCHRTELQCLHIKDVLQQHEPTTRDYQ
jgi:hypothetical protein